MMPKFWGRAWVASLVMTTSFSMLLAAYVLAADPAKPKGAAPADKGAKKQPVAKVDPKPTDSNETDYYELMKTFANTFEQIDRNYVKDVDRKELLEAAIRGMMTKLDPYSNYIGPDELDRFTQEVDQEFGGIGIQVHMDPKSNRLSVMTPLPGTPAYKAGMRAGDTIMEIQGKSTEGVTISEAVKLLKGKIGDEVTITIRRPNSTMLEKLTMKRDIIHVATVLGDHYKPDSTWDFMLDAQNKIGYIRLTHFSRRSADELRQALETLKSQGMKSLILDLRFNPGGLLSQATEISDMFIESGKIVSTKGRNTKERVWNASKPGTYSGFPMAILVNKYSASASEIVSACLQDHKRAVIIGERTWGKGSVQNVIELNGGSSALKLTTASYHRPSGKNIHKFPGAKDSDEWGVMPDKSYEVPFSTDDQQKYLIFRRERDVLSKDGPPKADFQDRQLARSIEYLKSQMKSASAEKKPEPATSKPAAAAPATSPEAKGKGDRTGLTLPLWFGWHAA